MLRERIAKANVPKSCLDETLNIATWNIRQFCKGARSPLALQYIAEIIDCFDLVSIVELGDHLDDLAYVLGILGPSWDVVFSDYVSDPGGNKERIGFVFDRRAVKFTGLAGHAQAPRKPESQRLAGLLGSIFGVQMRPRPMYAEDFLASFLRNAL